MIFTRMANNRILKGSSIILMIILILTGCQSVSWPFSGQQETEQPDNNMGESKKILMVIAPRDFRDEEYQEPREIFENNGYDVDVASIQTGTAVGVQGTEAEINTTAMEADADEYQAVVFVGGPGMAQITKDETLKMLARKFYEKNKLTAAICVAPAILAHADLLKDKKATSFPDAEDTLKANGVEFTGENVTVDGRIITANGPQAATEFGRTIISNLNN